MNKLLLSLLIATTLLPGMANATAQRILALTPHACEMLYAIGAETQLVGAVSFCDYPAEAKKLPRIGSYERINVEAALRLRGLHRFCQCQMKHRTVCLPIRL